ncbi:hypothetical protein ACU686_37385 [Yinghuangia aomiensis]
MPGLRRRGRRDHGAFRRTATASSSIAVALCDPDGQVTDFFTTLLNPDGPVGDFQAHGLFDDDIVEAPAFSDVAPWLAGMLRQRVVVAHNARFELGFLEREFQRRRHPSVPPLTMLCTMREAPEYVPEAPRFTPSRAARRPASRSTPATARAPRPWAPRGSSPTTSNRAPGKRGTGSRPAPSPRRSTGRAARPIRPARSPATTRTTPAAPAKRAEQARRRVAVSYLEKARAFGPPTGVGEGPDSYLAVLDAALEDRVITPEEAADLAELAVSLGISEAQRKDLDRLYVTTLAASMARRRPGHRPRGTRRPHPRRRPARHPAHRPRRHHRHGPRHRDRAARRADPGTRPRAAARPARALPRLPGGVLPRNSTSGWRGPGWRSVRHPRPRGRAGRGRPRRVRRPHLLGLGSAASGCSSSRCSSPSCRPGTRTRIGRRRRVAGRRGRRPGGSPGRPSPGSPRAAHDQRLPHAAARQHPPSGAGSASPGRRCRTTPTAGTRPATRPSRDRARHRGPPADPALPPPAVTAALSSVGPGGADKPAGPGTPPGGVPAGAAPERVVDRHPEPLRNGRRCRCRSGRRFRPGPSNRRRPRGTEVPRVDRSGPAPEPFPRCRRTRPAPRPRSSASRRPRPRRPVLVGTLPVPPTGGAASPWRRPKALP